MKTGACLALLMGALVATAEGQQHQPIYPAYDGYLKNPDGSYSMLVGYFNRNSKQVLEIPVGPNNKIEPGPPDQGQPTTFLPRRQWGVFTITVPKDFGDKKLTWTLTTNGKTNQARGWLQPEWEVDQTLIAKNAR